MKTAGLFLIFTAGAAANPIYTIAGLAGIPGSATGYAINSSGNVAGWVQNPSGGQQAFVSGPGGMRAVSSSNYESYAYGINSAGTVVGIAYDSNGQAHGTIWTAGGTTDLGAGSYAMGINDAGEVVGGNGNAFTVVNGQLQSLGSAPGMNWSAAYAVSNTGAVVGDGQLTNGSFRAVVWNPDGSVTVLGTLGGTRSQGTAVNDSGDVAGFASLADGYQNAFAEIGGMMIDLGTLGGGNSYAYGINDSRAVVGYSALADGSQAAFLYEDGTLFNLNSLIPANSGWDLLQAYGINDAGQITGVGLYDGQLTAFVLTDPLPGSAPVPEPRGLWWMTAILIAGAWLRSWRAIRADGRAAFRIEARRYRR